MQVCDPRLNGLKRSNFPGPAQVRCCVVLREGIMFDFKKNEKNSVPRPTIYCVWIPAYPDRDTPLIRVWIDPAMSMFESQAAVHEPDLADARAESSAAAVTASSEGGDS
jgi:hypothetical protein